MHTRKYLSSCDRWLSSLVGFTLTVKLTVGCTVVWKFTEFPVKLYIPFMKDACDFFSILGVVEYSQDRMTKKNALATSWTMSVFICVLVYL